MKKLLFFLLVFGLSGCNKSGDSSTSGEGSTPNSNSGSGGGSLSDLYLATSGYENECYNSVKRLWVFDNGNAYQYIKNHSDLNCTTPSYTEKQTYNISSSGTSSENTQATSIDLVPTTHEIAVHLSSVATAFNQLPNNGKCYKNNWTADNLYYGTNGFCGATAPFYTIFKISNNQLFFGDETNKSGDSAATRPSTILDSNPFTKK